MRRFYCARDKEPDCPCKHCLATKGPLYPDLGPSVAKFRKIPRVAITREQVVAYGTAIEERIRYLQRVALLGNGEVAHPCPCASGTWHNMPDGSVGRAVREQHRAALAVAPSAIRRARTDKTWVALYAEAMGRTEKEVWDSIYPPAALPSTKEDKMAQYYSSAERCLCPDFELRGRTYEVWTDELHSSNRCLVDPRKKEAVDTDRGFDPPLTNEELLAIYDYGKG